MYRLVPWICARYEGKITSTTTPLTEDERKIQEILKIDSAKHPYTSSLAKKILKTYGQQDHESPEKFLRENTIGSGTCPLTNQLRTYWKNYFQGIEMEEHAFFIGLYIDRYKIPVPSQSPDYHNIAALHWVLSGHSTLFREIFSKRESTIGQLSILEGLLLGTTDNTTELHKLLNDWGRGLNPNPLPKQEWKKYVNSEHEVQFYEQLLSIQRTAA